MLVFLYSAMALLCWTGMVSSLVDRDPAWTTILQFAGTLIWIYYALLEGGALP